MKSELIFVIVRLLSLFFSQSIILIFVYYLTSEQFGSLALILSLAQLSIVSISAWHSGTVLNHGQKFFSKTGTIYTVLSFRFIVIISVLLLTLPIFLSIIDGFKTLVDDFTGYPDSLYIILLFVIIEVVFDFSQNLLIVYGKLLVNSALIFILKLSCFLYVFMSEGQLESYFQFSLIAHILYMLIVLAIILSIDKINIKKIDSSKYSELLKFSLWGLGSSFSVIIANQAYNLIMRLYDLDLDSIGAHSVAFRILTSLSIVIYFVRVFYPKYLYRQGSFERIKFLRKVLNEYLFVYLVLVSILYIIISMVVYLMSVNMIIDSSYGDVTLYSILYFPSFIFFQRAQYLSVIVTNSRFFKLDNISFVLISLLGLTLNIILVYMIGVYGVIVSTLCSFIYYNVRSKRALSCLFFFSLRRY